MNKHIKWIIVAIIVVVFGWKIVSKIISLKQAPAGRGAARPVPVEVSPVVVKSMTRKVEFTGTLLPESRFIVAPKVAGRLEKLLVNIGDFVKNGDTIAILDNAEYAQQVVQSEAELQVSRAGLVDSQSAMDTTRREYERAKNLHDQKIASEAELDEAVNRLNAAEAKYKIAEAQIRQKEALLKAAEVRLSYTSIQAAWNESDKARVIAERYVDEGAMLRASDPIVAIVNMETITAVINVIERDFPLIRQGQKAIVTTDAFPNREFEGVIVRRAPVLQEDTRQARVEIEISNSDHLLAAGMFVRCKIAFAEKANATAVPMAALSKREGVQGVFSVNRSGTVAEFVSVKTGISEDGWVEVESPEISGEVVTIGQHLLENNSKILIINGVSDADKPI
ncbi:MAG: efflux RND transporter periplasmic adaptor subunit [Lentisphaerae bacterium]|nr:efflux RND transporter periplasmic adaptor subunit [Lentisphaerota bacterium]